MSIDGIGSGGMTTFGAEVVSSTLDSANAVNDGGGLTIAPVDAQTAGASVVTQTLDYMNQGGSGGDADYAFQKDVLSAAMFAKGGLTSTKA